ncbi:MAG: hypothetical protein AABZ08_07200 [Planctomycetota bacterium]
MRKALWIGGAFLLLVNAGLWLSVELDKAYIAGIAFQIAPKSSSDVEIVEAVTAYVRDRIYHPTYEEVLEFPWYVRWNYLYSRFRPGPGAVLAYGTHHIGPCQSNSRAFKALLNAFGIESRTIIQHDKDLLGIHSVVEVDYANTFGICGPTYGLVYKHPDGRPATLKDLRTNRVLFEENLKRGFAYGWGPNAKATQRYISGELYNFEKAYYFNYKWFGPFRWMAFNALHGLLGDKGPDLVVRPDWYTYPAYTTAIILDFGAAFVLFAYYLKRNSFRFKRRSILSRDSNAHSSKRIGKAPNLVKTASLSRLP